MMITAITLSPLKMITAKPCDEGFALSQSPQREKEEGGYFDSHTLNGVFITYQQNFEEYHGAKIEELRK